MESNAMYHGPAIGTAWVIGVPSLRRSAAPSMSAKTHVDFARSGTREAPPPVD